MNLSKAVVSILLLCLSSSIAFAQDKPNIVLIFLDNLGWGEPGFNCGGIIRGAATPRLDQLAEVRTQVVLPEFAPSADPAACTVAQFGAIAIRQTPD